MATQTGKTLLAAVVAFLALAQPSSAANLVQYWPLEEVGSTSATNAVATGHAANIRNQDPSTAWQTDVAPPLAARSHAAIYLDGDRGTDVFQHYLDLGIIGLEGSATLSFWVQPANLTMQYIELMNPVTDTLTYEGGMQIDTFGTGALQMYGYSRQVFNVVPDFNTIFAVGAWTHIALVFDRGRFTFYANGVPAGTNHMVFSYMTARLGLGTRGMDATAPHTANGGEAFAGGIDDVSVWDAAVSPQTVAQLASGVAPTAITDPAPAPIGAMLVHYYPLEGQAGASEAANPVGSSAGALVNFDTGTCWLQNTITGSNTPAALTNSSVVLAFDPTSSTYLDLGVLGLHGRGTVSLWINSAANSDVVNVFSQINVGTGERAGSRQPGRIVIDAAGKLRTQYSSSSDWQYLTPADSVPVNTWVHLALAYDNGFVTAYVNGERKSTGRTLLGFSAANFGVGNKFLLDAGYGSGFAGLMDDISIWDGPLSSASIKELASGVSPTNIVDVQEIGPKLGVVIETQPAAQLTQYWPLEEAPGSAQAANLAGGDVGQVIFDTTNLPNAWVSAPLAKEIAARSTTALQFNGVRGERLSVGVLDFGLSSAPNGTISLWVNPADLAGDRRILEPEVGASGDIGITAAGQVWVGDRNILWFVGSDYDTIKSNAWSHLAFTFADGLVTLYVNGVRQQTTPGRFNAVAWRFGDAYAGQYGGAFSGYMDDIATWNRSLSAENIALLANGAAPTSISQPAAAVAVLSWPAPFPTAVIERAPSPTGPWVTMPAVPRTTFYSQSQTIRSARLVLNPSATAEYYRLKY